MRIGMFAQDVDEFLPALPVEANVREVLPEKPEPFATQKERDQCEDDDRDERITAKEETDRLVSGNPAPRGCCARAGEVGACLHRRGNDAAAGATRTNCLVLRFCDND